MYLKETEGEKPAREMILDTELLPIGHTVGPFQMCQAVTSPMPPPRWLIYRVASHQVINGQTCNGWKQEEVDPKIARLMQAKDAVCEAAKIIKSDRDKLDSMQQAPGWRYNLERFNQAVDALMKAEAE